MVTWHCSVRAPSPYNLTNNDNSQVRCRWCSRGYRTRVIVKRMDISPEEYNAWESAMRRKRRITRKGVSLVYVAASMTALAGMISFAVDYGRVQLAKTELRKAADSAARAGAFGLGNYVTAQNLAVQFAGANNVDG